jgi:hypothetical protein
VSGRAQFLALGTPSLCVARSLTSQCAGPTTSPSSKTTSPLFGGSTPRSHPPFPLCSNARPTSNHGSATSSLRCSDKASLGKSTRFGVRTRPYLYLLPRPEGQNGRGPLGPDTEWDSEWDQVLGPVPFGIHSTPSCKPRWRRSITRRRSGPGPPRGSDRSCRSDRHRGRANPRRRNASGIVMVRRHSGSPQVQSESDQDMDMDMSSRREGCRCPYQRLKIALGNTPQDDSRQRPLHLSPHRVVVSTHHGDLLLSLPCRRKGKGRGRGSLDPGPRRPI